MPETVRTPVIVGDLVRLNSGSPDLRVISLIGNSIIVEWLDEKGAPEQDAFPLANVHKVKSFSGEGKMNRKLRRVALSPRFLWLLLRHQNQIHWVIEQGLPHDAVVRGYYHDPVSDTLYAIVQSEQFTEAAEGETVPELEIVYRPIIQESCTFGK